MNSCNTSILTIFISLNYFETFKFISNRFLSIILYRKPHCFQRPTTAEPAALLSRIYRVHADESPTKPRVCGQLLPLAALSVVYRINNDVGSRLIRNVLLILVYPPTASSITEDDRKRIYFHSAGNWELFLAHSLGSLPNPPPMTFLI